LRRARDYFAGNANRIDLNAIDRAMIGVQFS
jgi:hypothetical protein